MEEKLTFGSRLVHAFNVLRNRSPSQDVYYTEEGASYSRNPDRTYFYHFGNSQSILAPIYVRIAIDVAALTFMEVNVDDDGNFKSKLNSSLTNCLTLSANIDQNARQFKQECVMTLLEEGSVAIFPTKTDLDPLENGGYKIEELRVGTISEWFPKDVRVRLYNEETGMHEDIVYPKKLVAIVENPFFAVMNEANTVIQTVMQNFGYLDKINRQVASGKLNLIVQLPYTTKNTTKKKIADAHIKDIETQMSTSEHGIAFIDATEKVIQLNRSIDTDIKEQLTFVMNLLYSQLGLTEGVMNGTANEQEMLNYYNRCIEPIAESIALEMNRKFLTKTARTRDHAVMFFRNPFKLIPVEQIAEIGDRLTRNEILSTNEVRSAIGYQPSEDPRANELRNKNLNEQEGHEPIMAPGGENQNGS